MLHVAEYARDKLHFAERSQDRAASFSHLASFSAHQSRIGLKFSPESVDMRVSTAQVRLCGLGDILASNRWSVRTGGQASQER
jgi:hypothetical protein